MSNDPVSQPQQSPGLEPPPEFGTTGSAIPGQTAGIQPPAEFGPTSPTVPAAPRPDHPAPTPDAPRPDHLAPALDATAGEAEPAQSEPRTERPHPLTPFARSWILLVGALFFIGREFLPDGSGQPRTLPPLQFIFGGLGILVVLFGLIAFVTWWFTRFVIDRQEFRLETGVLFRSSKVVPFERIQTIDITQPLLARIMGLAELRIDAGSDSLTLRYLTRTKAYQFRDYLMSRATGRRISSEPGDGPGAGPGLGMLADLHATDEVVLRLSPKWVVIGFLLSAEFLSSVVFVLIGLVLVVVFSYWWLIFPMLIPAAIALVSMVPRRVLNQFNYTLSRVRHDNRADNLKVSRGLTALSSQSVPTDRIQGVRLRQSVLWRFWDLWQIDIDVLGQKATGDGDEKADIGSMLLPPAPPAEVATALAAIWPQVDIRTVPLHPVPGQARWLRPFTASRMRWGFDDRVIVVHAGRWSRVIDVVPHAKAQSVGIEQGPIQRKLGLASVTVHITPGPVQLRAAHLACDDARELATGQLVRSREARRPLN